MAEIQIFSKLKTHLLVWHLNHCHIPKPRLVIIINTNSLKPVCLHAEILHAYVLM